MTDAPGEEEEDSPEDDDSSEDDDFIPCEHEKLQIYDLNATAQERTHGKHILLKVREVNCDVFTPDKEGKIHGALVWDAHYGDLVTVTPNGAFVFNLCGEILASRLECRCDANNTNRHEPTDPGWCYHP